MAIKVLKCENCGAKLERNDKGILYCPNCGYDYSEKDEINNTYITHRTNIIKNYYGNNNKQGIDQETIKGYEERIIDAFLSNNIPEARNYCLGIIIKMPTNRRAVATKGFIENELRTSDGKYKSVGIAEISTLVSLLCGDDEIFSYIDVFDLATALLNNSTHIAGKNVLSICETMKERVEILNNSYTTEFLSAIEKYRIRVISAIAREEQLYKERQIQAEEYRQKQIEMENTRKKRNLLIGVIIGVIVIALITLVNN